MKIILYITDFRSINLSMIYKKTKMENSFRKI